MKELKKVKNDGNLKDKPGLQKALLGLLIYIQDNLQNLEHSKILNGEYEISLNCLLEHSFNFIKKSEKDTHRGYLKSLLLEKSTFLHNQNKKRNEVSVLEDFRNMIELSHKKGGGRDKEEKLILKSNIPLKNLTGKISVSSKKIILYKSGFKDTKIIDLFLEIDFFNSENKEYKKDLLYVFNFLGYNSSFQKNKEVLKRHLNRAINLEIFKSFSITKDSLIISKLKNENLNFYNFKPLYLGNKILDFNLNTDKGFFIEKEKDLNDFLFYWFNKNYSKDFKIEQEYIFKTNGRICKVDTVLFNKRDSNNIIFIEYKKTKDKRAPAQVLGYSGLYEQLNKLPIGTIKAVVIQNKFTEYDLGFLNSVSNLYFYKFIHKVGKFKLTSNLF